MTEASSTKSNRNAFLIVLVASLGYFVDIYDLLIFSIVRQQSLLAVGVKPKDVFDVGVRIINIQMFGMLLGGILWGVLGDKLGRIKTLFGCIILYSLANFANGMVHDATTYTIVRFIAGVGLAGELGAGITLVTEIMSQQKRGYGTMIVSAVGLLGAVVAALVGKQDWRIAYFVGGGLGTLLLLLRIGTFESGMFKNIENKVVSKGNFFKLFTNWDRLKKYLYCILIGAPNWFVIGVLITQAPEIGVALGAKGALSAGDGVLFSYIGISVGGIAAGLVSQLLKSRKITMYIWLTISCISVVVYLNAKGLTNNDFKWISFFLGTGVGYWTIFITVAAEQFGTNIRSTVATTVPNFIRASLIPILLSFAAFKINPNIGTINGAYILMAVLTLISFFSVSQLKESFHKDLDYVEEL